jgi:D-alanine-D-alanine ligase
MSVTSLTEFDFLRVLILQGGPGYETVVSQRGAEKISKTLKNLGYHVELLEVSPQLELLKSHILNSFDGKGPQMIFNNLHGPYGEGGGVQIILESLHIPFSGSGYKASQGAMHKPTVLRMAQSFEISVSNWHEISGIDYTRIMWNRHQGKDFLKKSNMSSNENMLRLFFEDHIIKPENLGSSIHTYHVKKEDRFFLDYDILQNNFILMSYIPGFDVTLAVDKTQAYEGVAISCGDATILDYQAKYHSQEEEMKNARTFIPDTIMNDIQENTLKIFNHLGCRGLARADWRFNPQTQEAVFLEINTQPGMTERGWIIPSIYYKNGMDYTQIIKHIIHLALKDHEHIFGNIRKKNFKQEIYLDSKASVT